jgi:hypothetical protein
MGSSINKSGVRRIHRDNSEIYAEKMMEKLQSEQAKEKLKIRRLSNVQGEFNLMCIAHNINKIYILLTILPLLAVYQYLKDQIIAQYKDLSVYIQKNNRLWMRC